jgi:transcriptional regulator with XRE-family HTH domain
VAVDWNAVDYKEFGRFVRGLREARGLEQQELAEISQVSAATIRHIERGYGGGRKIGRKILQALSLALVEGDPDYLYNWLPQRGKDRRPASMLTEGAEESATPAVSQPMASSLPSGPVDKMTQQHDPEAVLLADFAHLRAAQESFAREQQDLAAQVRYVVSAVDEIRSLLKAPPEAPAEPGLPEDR